MDAGNKKWVDADIGDTAAGQLIPVACYQGFGLIDVQGAIRIDQRRLPQRIGPQRCSQKQNGYERGMPVDSGQ